jgi:hypothetical protein
LAADAFYSIYLLRYLEEDKSLSLIARDYDRVCAAGIPGHSVVWVEVGRSSSSLHSFCEQAQFAARKTPMFFAMLPLMKMKEFPKV